MKKTRKFTYLFLILLISVSAIFHSGCSYILLAFKSDKEIYFEITFGKDISAEIVSINDVELLYTYDTVFNGEGTYYLAWQFYEQPDNWLNSKSFYTNKYATGTEEERALLKQNFQKRTERIFTVSGRKIEEQVPEEYRPDWEADFLFAGNMEDGSYFSLQGRSFYYNTEAKILIYTYYSGA